MINDFPSLSLFFPRLPPSISNFLQTERSLHVRKPLRKEAKRERRGGEKSLPFLYASENFHSVVVVAAVGENVEKVNPFPFKARRRLSLSLPSSFSFSPCHKIRYFDNKDSGDWIWCWETLLKGKDQMEMRPQVSLTN